VRLRLRAADSPASPSSRTGRLVAGESLIRTVTVKAGTAADGQLVVLPPGDYLISARLMDVEYGLRSDAWRFSLR
jgi:hypothetical protein